MRNFYGLRFISTVYKLLAVLTVIFTLVSVSVLMSDVYLTTQTFQLNFANGNWNWAMQSFMTLFFGGLLALSFYVLAQMIDLSIDSHQALQRTQGQIEKTNELAQNILELQKKQLRRTYQNAEKEINDVAQQIAARKVNIQIDSEVN
jgi:hypothetical protein